MSYQPADMDDVHYVLLDILAELRDMRKSFPTSKAVARAILDEPFQPWVISDTFTAASSQQAAFAISDGVGHK